MPQKRADRKKAPIRETGLWDKDMSLACFRRTNWISCEYKINHAVCKVCRNVVDPSKKFLTYISVSLGKQ